MARTMREGVDLSSPKPDSAGAGPPMSGRPQLAVVVDTEEEFDWFKPFARENVSTRSIPAQLKAHDIYDRFGIVPTYVIGYPIAVDPGAIALLGGLREEGRAEIGAHPHPWVTPPHEEEVSHFNSYHCNLPPELERAKIAALTAAITENFGAPPRVFKAGRYGFGTNTARALKALGYTVDCSYVPYFSYAADGGPSYYGAPDQPFWLDEERELLEIPATTGFVGLLPGLGRHMQPLFDSDTAKRLHLTGLLARLNLVGRSRLGPEGISAEEQCRLLSQLVARGRRMFTLTYHSPSLAPGNTRYVKSEEDVARFLARIEKVLRFFADEIGGEFTTLTRYRASSPVAAMKPIL
jgi:hypothetical protein